jgi:hypothetical protein
LFLAAGADLPFLAAGLLALPLREFGAVDIRFL